MNGFGRQSGRFWQRFGRATLAGAFLLISSHLCPRRYGHADEGPLPASERALRAGTQALIAAQSQDGAWRSKTYGSLKDGLSLTPAVLKAVVFAPDVEGSDQARRRGLSYLISRVSSDGKLDTGPFGLTYPVYSASAAAIVLTRADVEGRGRGLSSWLRELRRHQLTEALGWCPQDPGYGGWGDSANPATKPPDGTLAPKPPDANLSSTLFAVGALRMAGVPADDPGIRKALVFVAGCQNDPGGPRPEPAFDDGGFFFTPTDPVRNKAGVAGNDGQGRRRFHSYGSATADGLRALLRCGMPHDHPRVLAARAWLERHFSVKENPGRFEPLREPEREATYYYYTWSVAHALRALGVERIDRDGTPVDWAGELSRELVRRQRPDGFWQNRASASREDDPFIATAFALGALANCRMVGGHAP